MVIGVERGWLATPVSEVRRETSSKEATPEVLALVMESRFHVSEAHHARLCFDAQTTQRQLPNSTPADLSLGLVDINRASK